MSRSLRRIGPWHTRSGDGALTNRSVGERGFRAATSRVLIRWSRPSMGRAVGSPE